MTVLVPKENKARRHLPLTNWLLDPETMKTKICFPPLRCFSLFCSFSVWFFSNTVSTMLLFCSDSVWVYCSFSQLSTPVGTCTPFCAYWTDAEFSFQQGAIGNHLLAFGLQGFGFHAIVLFLDTVCARRLLHLSTCGMYQVWFCCTADFSGFVWRISVRKILCTYVCVCDLNCVCFCNLSHLWHTTAESNFI